MLVDPAAEWALIEQRIRRSRLSVEPLCCGAGACSRRVRLHRLESHRHGRPGNGPGAGIAFQWRASARSSAMRWPSPWCCMLALIIDLLAPLFGGAEGFRQRVQACGLFLHAGLARRNFPAAAGPALFDLARLLRRLCAAARPAAADESAGAEVLPLRPRHRGLRHRADARRRRHSARGVRDTAGFR